MIAAAGDALFFVDKNNSISSWSVGRESVQQCLFKHHFFIGQFFWFEKFFVVLLRLGALASS